MRFPLDVVGVRRNGDVVSIKCQVVKRRLVVSLRAFAMVELESGVCTRVGLRVGDRLQAGPSSATLASNLGDSRMS